MQRTATPFDLTTEGQGNNLQSLEIESERDRPDSLVPKAQIPTIWQSGRPGNQVAKAVPFTPAEYAQGRRIVSQGEDQPIVKAWPSLALTREFA